MAKIKTELEYRATMDRIEELLSIVGENTPVNDKNMIELVLLSDLVEEYDTEHYPISLPALPEMIKLRMAEMDINQTALSKILNLSASRISDYLNGRSEPTLKVARDISMKLNIDANIVLGVI
jgi:HTH-type transcriptional regulator/antitoxin HigA